MNQGSVTIILFCFDLLSRVGCLRFRESSYIRLCILYVILRVRFKLFYAHISKTKIFREKSRHEQKLLKIIVSAKNFNKNEKTRQVKFRNSTDHSYSKNLHQSDVKRTVT